MSPNRIEPPGPSIPPQASRRTVTPAGREVDGVPGEAAHPIEPAFRHLAESLSDLVWSARPDGYSDYYNRGFLEYVGRTLGEMRGWTWAETLHPDDADRARRAWEEASATEGEYEIEFRMRRHDGAYRWFRSRGTPMRDEAGRVARWFGTCIDIEERRAAAERLRESEATLRAFFENSPALAGVVEPTVDGDILHVYDSPTTCRFFGAEPGSTAGRRAGELGAPPEVIAQWLDAYRRSEASDEPVRFEYEHRVGGDVGRWLSVTVSPIGPGPGARPRFCYVAEDITDRRRGREALRASEERLRLALEAGRMGTWDWDLRTGALAWSENLGEVHGLPPGSFDGTIRGFRRLVHPEDRGRVEEAIARAISGVCGYEAEFRIVRPDGSVGWMLGVGRVFADAAGRPARMLGVGMDITGRKRDEERLRHSEQRFARFMQHLPGLAWIKDARGRYVYANEPAERAFGTPRADLYGKTDAEVFPPATAEAFGEHDRRALEAGAGVRVVESLEHLDGTVHHSLVSKFPIPSPEGEGEGVLVGGIALDITDRMAMEEALREADRRKGEFLATLAHELRNPLAPIRNAAALLAAHPAVAGEPGAAAEVEMVGRQVAHLARLVDDLMDIARIERGKIDLRRGPLDLAEVLRRAADAARPALQEHGHRLRLALPEGPALVVEADPTRLEQVAGNLLHNAIKYTEPGGEIALEAGLDGDQAVIRVRDTGVGIPPEMLPRIFDPFVQVDGHAGRSRGGLGIGLGLVKGLVELHGGTIEAFSDGPGSGSEFVVRLPALPEAMAPRSLVDGTQEGADARPPVRRVLVVDDNRDAARSLARLLARLHGQDVRVAHDGPEALALAGEFLPEVVLLDIGMPGMDGHEVARRLRERPESRSALIVALTGWGQEADRLRSSAAGFDLHLVKPVDPDAVRGLLDRPRPDAPASPAH